MRGMKTENYQWRKEPGDIPRLVRCVRLGEERGNYHRVPYPRLRLGDSISKSAICCIVHEHIWQCGDYYEITRTREGALEGVPPPAAAGTKAEKESSESIEARSVARARRRVRRLVNANRLYDMVTLTLAPDVGVLDSRNGESWRQIPLEEQFDRQRIIALWDAYRRRMRDVRGKDFPYVCVIEKHTGKRAGDTTIKTGTYHVHYCTSIRLQGADLKRAEGFIQKIWGHGLCNITPWDRGRRSEDLGPIDLPPATNPGAYMAKYFGEKGDDATGREQNQRRYWTSRGLVKPAKVPPESIDVEELELIWENAVEVDGKKILISQTYRRVR